MRSPESASFLRHGGQVRSEQLAVALARKAPATSTSRVQAPLPCMDDRGQWVVHRPRSERAERHDGDIGLLAGRQAADTVAHAEHRRTARGDPVERFAGGDRRGWRECRRSSRAPPHCRGRAGWRAPCAPR